MTGKESQVSRALDGVAKRHGVPITSFDLAYAMHKAANVFPILGGRKVAHLKANMEALGLQLSPQDIEDVENGYDFDPGFRHNCINMELVPPNTPQRAIGTSPCPRYYACSAFVDHVQIRLHIISC